MNSVWQRKESLFISKYDFYRAQDSEKFIYVYIYIYIMSKIISVADDVYEELKARKGKDSYSAVIRKSLKRGTNRDSLLEFAGKGGIDEKKIRMLGKMWKKWIMRYV